MCLGEEQDRASATMPRSGAASAKRNGTEALSRRLASSLSRLAGSSRPWPASGRELLHPHRASCGAFGRGFCWMPCCLSVDLSSRAVPHLLDNVMFLLFCRKVCRNSEIRKFIDTTGVHVRRMDGALTVPPHQDKRQAEQFPLTSVRKSFGWSAPRGSNRGPLQDWLDCIAFQRDRRLSP
jgi:hypothetical protein